MKIFRAFLALLFLVSMAHANELFNIEKAAFTSFSSFLPSSTNLPFSLPSGDVLHYMSPTGSDAANGLTTGTAWLTPNHALHCGDVIIAAAGSYTTQFQQSNWGAVTSCPSTTGGIDGAGGVYFSIVLCAGPVITSCQISPVAGEATRVDASNWAVEGFKATSASTCFSSTSESSSVVIHHVAFINDISSGCTSSGFNSYSYLGAASGVDQVAVVGAIAFNAASSASSGNCTSGVSIIPSNGPDTSAGTHVIVAGYFGYENINGNGCDAASGHTTDGEGVIFDSWSCNNFTHQGVIEQTAVWKNGGAGIEVFPNTGGSCGTDQAVYAFKSITAYGDYQDNNHKGNQGELALQNLSPTGSYLVTGSIFQATTLSTNGGAVYDMVALQTWCVTNCTSQVSVTGNYGWQSNPGSSTSAGNFNTDVYNSNIHNATTWPFGTNTYNNAGFAAAGSLPTTAPSCGAYTNTTDCMNAGLSIAADLTPSGGAAGLGYAAPGACASDSLYPTWLKGVVYLQWNSGASTISENSGLVTKPCGL